MCRAGLRGAVAQGQRSSGGRRHTARGSGWRPVDPYIVGSVSARATRLARQRRAGAVAVPSILGWQHASPELSKKNRSPELSQSLPTCYLLGHECVQQCVWCTSHASAHGRWAVRRRRHAGLVRSARLGPERSARPERPAQHPPRGSRYDSPSPLAVAQSLSPIAASLALTPALPQLRAQLRCRPARAARRPGSRRRTPGRRCRRSTTCR